MSLSLHPKVFLPARHIFGLEPSSKELCHLFEESCSASQESESNAGLSPAIAPREFVATDIHEQLLKTSRENNFFFILTDRHCRLPRTLVLKKVTAVTVANTSVIHWVLIYGPPLWLLSNDGKQLTTRIFQHICQILDVENLLVTTCGPQCSRQAEKVSLTIPSSYLLLRPQSSERLGPVYRHFILCIQYMSGPRNKMRTLRICFTAFPTAVGFRTEPA